jgi:hypothetical protein
VKTGKLHFDFGKCFGYGANVMISIFGDFEQFFAKKSGSLLENNFVMNF